MKFFCLLLALFFFLPGICNAQQGQLKGIVRDANTNAPLPFVSILVNKGPAGTTTNIDGKFQISSQEPVHQLSFSYLGYQTLQFSLEKPETGLLTITLQPLATSLQEVVVRANAGPNPAHRIIELATANRKNNDPGQLPAYTCRVYTKTVVSMQPAPDEDFADTLSLPLVAAPADSANPDTSGFGVEEFLKKNYLFLSESVSERAFMRPDLSKETVLATRISGLQKPSFALLATNSQDFSVYQELVNFFGKMYLSPLSGGSTRKYNFRLEDTTFSEADTTFIISYQPLPGKNFEGLKGQLHITSNGWAVVNIIAEAAEKDRQNVRLQQHYEKVGRQKWFPVQVTTDLLITNPFMPDLKSTARSRSYYTNINLQPALKRRDFKAVTVKMAPDAASQPESFWQKYRPDSLTAKEITTYHNLDSLGKSNNLDARFRLMEAIFSKQLPFGPLSLDVDRLLSFNRYEAVRAGLGLHTNEQLSGFFTLGGYAGYGFRDKAFKYGSDLSFNLYKPSGLKLTFTHTEDILESGGTVLPFYELPLLSNNLRPGLIKNMDRVTHQSAFVVARTLKYLDLRVGLQQENKRPGNGYVFRTGPDTFSSNFYFTEAVVGMRYAFREQVMQMFNRTISMGTKYPVLYFQYRRGLNKLLNGQFSYHKLDLRAEKKVQQKALGTTLITFTAGLVTGAVPYPNLYNGSGAHDPDYYIYSGEGFQTMGLTEFLSDRYTALFLHHDFGGLLYRSNGFSPTLAAVTNIGFGSLQHPERHRNLAFSTMEKGYYESGLMVNDLLGTGFFGLGIGGFYRYGAYSKPIFKDNLALKGVLNFKF